MIVFGCLEGQLKAQQDRLIFQHPLTGTSRCPGPSDSSEYSISILNFVVAVVGPSRSSLALRIKTSSSGFWLIFARKNRKPLPGPSWCPQPGRHLPRCRFSQEANSKPHISNDATEKTMAWTTAGSRSGMGGYEWHATHSEPGFRINQRELLQISNHGQQNQRGCLLSTGPLYFLYFMPPLGCCINLHKSRLSSKLV